MPDRRSKSAAGLQVLHDLDSTIVTPPSRFIEALPMTVTGKVQKYLLREGIQAELGLARRENV